MLIRAGPYYEQCCFAKVTFSAKMFWPRPFLLRPRAPRYFTFSEAREAAASASDRVNLRPICT